MKKLNELMHQDGMDEFTAFRELMERRRQNNLEIIRENPQEDELDHFEEED